MRASLPQRHPTFDTLRQAARIAQRHQKRSAARLFSKFPPLGCSQKLHQNTPSTLRAALGRASAGEPTVTITIQHKNRRTKEVKQLLAIFGCFFAFDRRPGRRSPHDRHYRQPNGQHPIILLGPPRLSSRSTHQTDAPQPSRLTKSGGPTPSIVGITTVAMFYCAVTFSGDNRANLDTAMISQERDR